MKIILEDWGDHKHRSHAWDEESRPWWAPLSRMALCGKRVVDTKSDDAAAEVTCGSCLRLLAAKGFDAKLQPIAGK